MSLGISIACLSDSVLWRILFVCLYVSVCEYVCLCVCFWVSIYGCLCSCVPVGDIEWQSPFSSIFTLNRWSFIIHTTPRKNRLHSRHKENPKTQNHLPRDPLEWVPYHSSIRSNQSHLAPCTRSIKRSSSACTLRIFRARNFDTLAEGLL